MLKQIIKKLLPKDLVWKLASFKEKFDLFKKKMIKSNRLFIMMSLFFNEKYYREHKSFLEGSFRYDNAVQRRLINESFLRRNIHRIEKGMLMKPRRDVFALRFILPTVQAFIVFVEQRKRTTSEYQWAYQVLKRYFQLVESKHTQFLEARELFNGIEISDVEKTEEQKIPFKVNKSNTIKLDDFYKLNSSRKSVRWYSDKPVPKESIDKALEIASLAPSSCNRSPYRYIICNNNKELIQKIAKIPAGTVGWYSNIPAIAVLVGKQSAFTNLANRHSIYVDATLSVMPFVLALETIGISSCLINWADDKGRDKRMREALGMSEDECVIVSISMGYADDSEMVAYSQRKYNNEISEYIS